MTTRLLLIYLVVAGLCTEHAAAQNDVMMQAFYWDVPVDVPNKNGTWWDNLKNKSTILQQAGIKALWVPSPAKGNFGIYDMGYGIFDLYDLGNYNQKGTTETRFGSRAELEQMITTLHSKNIEVYADIVLNHLYTSDEQDESNPAVKQYVFDQAYRNGSQYSPYPTNEIRWVIKNAAPGDYYIQIHGYHLNNPAKSERGYDVQIDYTGSGFNSTYSWEVEPNNGGGNFTVFPASGNTVRGHVEVNDVDEYKVTVTSTRDVVIRLTARRENSNPWEWAWADQTNGYYPKFIWFNGTNLASTVQLEARTNTKINYVNHTGVGEANFSWGYADFHPVNNTDWLGYPGSDEIITNTKFFGNDLNTFSTTVAQRYQAWGTWLVNTIGFDGFRLDFVRGFQESYVANWIKNLPLKNGSQRFIVGEYWGPDYRIKNWVNAVAANGADADGFDFPLKFSLNGLCNGNGSSYDMRWLNHAGLVRNNSGNSLPGTSVVTWLENHDTGKEHDKWITKDWKLGYAYILTHEGRPCIFYNHYFGDVMTDSHNSSLTVTPDPALAGDIRKLIFARKTYLGGSLTVLSQVGNPYPAADAYNVYVARRAGNGTKSGAIVVINNHDSQTKGLWVDAAPAGWASWSGQVLVNAFNPAQTAQVYADGRVFVSAPARGYAVYVKQSEYVAYADPGARTSMLDEDTFLSPEENDAPEMNVWSNPTKDKVKVVITSPRTENVLLELITMNGMRMVQQQTISNQTIELDLSTFPKGMYVLRAAIGTHVKTSKVIRE